MQRIFSSASFAVGAIMLSASALLTTAQAQDVNAGQQIFAECAGCHEVTATNGFGPGLLGIVGRKSASEPGFRYSAALQHAELTWDVKNLNAFLTDPQKLVPGNLMPFPGMDDAQARADLIAYLQTVK